MTENPFIKVFHIIWNIVYKIIMLIVKFYAIVFVIGAAYVVIRLIIFGISNIFDLSIPVAALILVTIIFFTRKK
jgi:hypothetical protein